MQQRPCHPIQLPDHQRIPRLQRLQAGCETRAGLFRAGRHILVEIPFRDPCGQQGIPVEVELLLFGGDPHVAEQLIHSHPFAPCGHQTRLEDLSKMHINMHRGGTVVPGVAGDAPGCLRSARRQVFGTPRYEAGGPCCLARHIAWARRTTASWSALVAMASRCSSCSCVSPLSTLSAAKTWAKNSPQPCAMTALEAPSASISLLSVAPRALYRRSSLC